jgi:hypothetical protein
LTWSDCNEPKGFHIFDTKTSQLDFIENKTKLYKKVYFNEDEDYMSQIEDIAGKTIKIFVLNKKSENVFQRYILEVEKKEPESFLVIDTTDQIFGEDGDVSVENKSIIELIPEYLKEISQTNPLIEKLLIKAHNDVTIEA